VTESQAIASSRSGRIGGRHEPPFPKSRPDARGAIIEPDLAATIAKLDGN